jgi:hypothetical protein
MIERQVRYYRTTETGEQESTRHKWTFMIINEPREIGRIKERIYTELYPIAELKSLYHEPLEFSGGLQCDFFSFLSSKGKIERPEKIYKSKNLKADRDLTVRADVECERFLMAILDGRK